MSSGRRFEDLLPRLNAIILDMDGVVIDSEPLHERAQEHIFAKHGLDVPPSEYANFKGRTEHDVFSYILDRYGAPHHDLQSLVAAKHEAYHLLLTRVEPVVGVMDFIQAFRPHYRFALTTSAAATSQRIVFDQLDLDDCFEVVVTSADVSHSKPHPDPYLITTSRLGIDPGTALVVEDSRLGVQSALAAGCVTVGLTGTFSRTELEEESPHLVVDSFAELHGILAAAAVASS